MKSDNKKALRDVLKSFMDSYDQRDKEAAFQQWLAERIKQDLPEMSDEDCKSLCVDIVEGIERYDRVLENLNESIEAGQSKEEWFAERLEEAYVDMPLDEAGSTLMQLESDLNESNANLMTEIEAVPEGTVFDVVADVSEWNEYSVKSKVLDIGKQAVMAGIGAAAGAAKQNIEDGEAVEVGEVIENALNIGVDAAVGEVKAVVAGAIKVAAEKGLADILPSDTPIENICDMAGAAVECADAVMNAAQGKTSIMEAIERSARACVAAVCRFGAFALKFKLTKIPVVGPVVAVFAGGLINHMQGPKFADNVYNVLRDAAVATWDGIKQAASGLVGKFKNFSLQKLLN